MDAHDVIEWSASQAWSDGNVGMFGLSYMGGIQLLAAGTQPPHLRSLFAGQTPFSQFDIHQTIVPAQGPFPEPGDPSDWCLLGQCDNVTIPVDADRPGGQLLTAALAEHRLNQNPGPLPFRDSVSAALGVDYYAEASPASYVQPITQANPAVYLYCNEDNWLSQGTILSYVNLQVSTKKLLLLGPNLDFDVIAEHRRWFDATLKGSDDGIGREPPIKYFSAGFDAQGQYRTASTWPPAPQTATDYYFSADALGNRTLATQKPGASSASDNYQVVYGISSSTLDLDARGLSYTTPPLAADTELTGYPISHLWISSTAPDGDFVGWLEEVDALGNSVALLDPLQGPAKLRASLRSLGQAPYDNLGLPWHPARQADVQPLKGEPVELVFDMLFVSHVFARGNSIRLTVTGGNADTPTVDPAPTVKVYRDADHASYIELPVVHR